MYISFAIELLFHPSHHLIIASTRNSEKVEITFEAFPDKSDGEANITAYYFCTSKDFFVNRSGKNFFDECTYFFTSSDSRALMERVAKRGLISFKSAIGLELLSERLKLAQEYFCCKKISDFDFHQIHH